MASRNNFQKWRALGADRASVAEARMEKVLTELRTARKVRVSVGRGVMSFADAASVWEVRVKADPDLADRTKEFYFYGLAKLRKSWLEMDQFSAEKSRAERLKHGVSACLKAHPMCHRKQKRRCETQQDAVAQQRRARLLFSGQSWILRSQSG
jgi:hypothetical protein